MIISKLVRLADATDDIGGINSILARYLLQYMVDGNSLNIYKVAEDCHVSAPSVSRFVKKLGFADFIEFKERLDYELLLFSPKFNAYHIKDWQSFSIDDTNKEIEDKIMKIADGIKDIINPNALQGLDSLAKDIKIYQNVVFFNSVFNQLITDHIRVELSTLQKDITIMTECDRTRDFEKQKSIAVIVTMNGYWLAENCKIDDYLKQNFSKIYILTQAPLASHIGEIIQFGKSSNMVANYMGWILIAEQLVYAYRDLSENC